jgi:hypothetical protein
LPYSHAAARALQSKAGGTPGGVPPLMNLPEGLGSGCCPRTDTKTAAVATEAKQQRILCVCTAGRKRRKAASTRGRLSRDGALRNRAAGHWVPGPAAQQPVTAAKNRWCAEFAAGCLPVACMHASAASQLPVGSGPARPHGEVGYWEAAGQNRVELFCHFPALSSRLLSAPSLVCRMVIRQQAAIGRSSLGA